MTSGAGLRTPSGLNLSTVVSQCYAGQCASEPGLSAAGFCHDSRRLIGSSLAVFYDQGRDLSAFLGEVKLDNPKKYREIHCI